MKKLTCHCGEVEAEVNLPEKLEKVLRCNCSICKRKGYIMTMVGSDDLKITGGIINSLKGAGNDTTRMQIDATINPGNSGGPIVDKLSKSLIGVAVAQLSKDFTKAFVKSLLN